MLVVSFWLRHLVFASELVSQSTLALLDGGLFVAALVGDFILSFAADPLRPK